MNETIIEIIKGMLAPGIMISACGLLLLGMNNKYSLVVNRIRNLNSEFRSLDESNSARKNSILIQIPLLITRMKLIRNAVWLYTVAIAMFILLTFLLGLFLFFGKYEVLSVISITMFIIGMSAVLLGVLYAAREVMVGYKILKIETKNIM